MISSHSSDDHNSVRSSSMSSQTSSEVKRSTSHSRFRQHSRNDAFLARIPSEALVEGALRNLVITSFDVGKHLQNISLLTRYYHPTVKIVKDLRSRFAGVAMYYLRILFCPYFESPQLGHFFFDLKKNGCVLKNSANSLPESAIGILLSFTVYA